VWPTSPGLNDVAENFSLEDPEPATVRKQLMGQDLEYMSLAPAEGRVLRVLIRGFGFVALSKSALCRVIPACAWPRRCRPTVRSSPSRKNRGAAPSPMHTRALSLRSTFAAGMRWNCSRIYINDPVDMVFIDADKAGYVKYLDWVGNKCSPGCPR